MDVYGVIVYINYDCLVIKDISHIFDWDDTSSSLSSKQEEQQQQKCLIVVVPDIFPTKDKSINNKGGLIAAALDIFLSNKFIASVMIVWPNQSY